MISFPKEVTGGGGKVGRVGSKQTRETTVGSWSGAFPDTHCHRNTGAARGSPGVRGSFLGRDI